MAAVKLEAALHDLTTALETGGSRDGRLRAARQVLVKQSAAALQVAVPDQTSIGALAKLAQNAPARDARRFCAAMLVHALAVPGLVPPAAFGDAGALIESALRDVLLRCGYPFTASADEKVRVLARLHGSLAELMLPLEPTFPNWQGLYAGN
jgi:hypothetical protein